MAVNSHLAVFPDMSASTVFTGGKLGRGRTYLKRLGGTSFDYVLCDRKTMTVVCAVSLGSPKGFSGEQKKLKKLCELAELPLLEYGDKPYRNVPALRRQIFLACGIKEHGLPMNISEENNSSSAREEQGRGTEKMECEEISRVL